ncbi:MAG: ferredoxin:glutaredoxin reductase [Methanoculleus sp. SDB]|nr:MAG: ferredoxin:glutaredoxin reductase [Methanoculleus sp. SDB]
MKKLPDVSEDEISARVARLRNEAEHSGYHLNPDMSVTRHLVRGLIANEKRYGYQACPCRRAAGKREDDLDIVCPCDYRDPDLAEYGSCYCALYVSDMIAEGRAEAAPIPERRPAASERSGFVRPQETDVPRKLAYPVLRCPVCGYICARNAPPEHCPICHATGERFRKFF